MQEQRSRAKADAKAKKGSGVNTEVYTELRALGETPFLGFDTLGAGGTVRGIVVDGELVHSAAARPEVELILDETPFYPGVRRAVRRPRPDLRRRRRARGVRRPAAGQGPDRAQG